jgi:hypothetical protein
MSPSEIANEFVAYLEEGTTPKGTKVQSFFSHLSSSQKRLVAKNIAKAYSTHVKEESEMIEMRKKMKKEISELKKKAKELGLIISEK